MGEVHCYFVVSTDRSWLVGVPGLAKVNLNPGWVSVDAQSNSLLSVTPPQCDKPAIPGV